MVTVRPDHFRLMTRYLQNIVFQKLITDFRKLTSQF